MMMEDDASFSSSSSLAWRWWLKEYCESQQQRDGDQPELQLHDTSKEFLSNLGLPSIHPYCTESAAIATAATPPPPEASLTWDMLLDVHDGSYYETFVTYMYMTIPPIYACFNLWFRLFAGVLSPLGILYLSSMVLLKQQQQQQQQQRKSSSATTTTTTKSKHNMSIGLVLIGIIITTVSSSIVVMTDAMYVYELNGPYIGICLFGCSIVLSLRVLLFNCGKMDNNKKKKLAITSSTKKAPRKQRSTTMLLLLSLSFITWLFFLVVASDYKRTWSATPLKTMLSSWSSSLLHIVSAAPDDGINIKIEPGLYYNRDDPYMRQVVENYWPQNKRSYDPTPWMYTGDARTGLPFFLNKVVDIPVYHRRYLTVKDNDNDGKEVILALDVSFPVNHNQYTHNESQPIYMVLHGVNGDSDEPYVQDFVGRCNNEYNSTVVVMISRGLSDTPIKGYNFFHGARWSDAHAAATAIKRAMSVPSSSSSSSSSDKHQILAGVGYSMGAIVLSNYVSRSGRDCALDAAFSISGALECRYERNYTRAKKLWQPMIVDYMKSNQHLTKFVRKLKKRLSQQEFIRMLRTTHVVGLDEVMSTGYNGYRSIEHFYEEMGAVGDIPLSELTRPTALSTPPTTANTSSNNNQATTNNEMSPQLRSHGSYSLMDSQIPLGVLHAFDDPISTWRTVAANDGMMNPSELVRHLGNGKIVLLLTAKGGHVGWPTGWFPSNNNWKFMSQAAASFVEAVDKASKGESVE